MSKTRCQVLCSTQKCCCSWKLLAEMIQSGGFWSRSRHRDLYFLLRCCLDLGPSSADRIWLLFSGVVCGYPKLVLEASLVLCPTKGLKLRVHMLALAPCTGPSGARWHSIALCKGCSGLLCCVGWGQYLGTNNWWRCFYPNKNGCLMPVTSWTFSSSELVELC